MMELDFRGCKTRKDVEAVFEKERKRLGDDVKSIDLVKELFFSDVDGCDVLKVGDKMEKKKE